MKKAVLIGSVVALGIASIIAACAGCAAVSDGQIRAERARVNELVTVGHGISDAQSLLSKEGYKFLYETPIHPTEAKDYLQQVVVIGDTQRTAIDTFFYVTTGGRNPFRKESPYLIIEAGNNGVVTKVE